MSKGLTRGSKKWIGAMVASALLFQIPNISLAEETANEEQFALDEVVVTANRIPTPVSQTAENVTVITQKQIANGPYSDIGDVLRDVNGISVATKGFGGADQTVVINGDERVLVMIDGRKISRPQGASGRASVDLNSIVSLSNIERIEVIKGGASALYGSDAVGGVINIITKKGTETKTELNLSAGSWGERNYGLSAQGSEGGFSWYITADQKKQDYVKYNVLNPNLVPGSNKGEGQRWPNSKYEGQGFTMRLDKSIDDTRSVTFNFEHWDDKGGQPFSVESVTSIDRASHLSNNWALTYDFNIKESIPGFVRVYSNYANQSFWGTYKSRTQGVAYQTGWQLDDRHKLITGIDWERGEVLENTYDNGGIDTVNYKNKSVDNAAIYLQDIFNLADKWTVTPGVRYDHHSSFGGQTTPKVNINYSADSSTNIYASYNRVFKAPNLDDLYYDIPAYSWKGNPNLKPERGHVVSLGMNKKVSDKTSVNTNYFNSRLTDAIDWDFDAATNTTWARNIDKQKKHGFEVDLRHELSDKYYTELGYSYVHIENNEKDSGYLVDSNNTQPNSYRVKVGYADSEWNVNVNGQAATGRDESKFVDSSYWVWNLAANYKMTKDALVYLNVYNLGDKAYEIKSSHEGTGKFGNYPMPSRHFQLGVKYSF